MILVLCCNAAMDRTYQIQNFRPGQFYHASQFRVVAGGKGINVARVLRTLGHEVVVSGFAGGMVGRFILTDLRRSAIRTAFVDIAEESRLVQNFIDPVAHTETRLDEVGPLVSPRELRKLERLWAKLLADVEIAVISGSVPRGLPDNLYFGLLEAAHHTEVPVVVDTHDGLLAQAVSARPQVITPNLSELQTLVKQTLTVPDGVVAVSNKLLDSGIELVLTSLGQQGAIAVSKQGNWWVKPPSVEVVSPVGSGDALVAGLVSAFVEHLPLAERLKWAVAAGSASAAIFGAGISNREAIAQLLPQTELTQLR